MRTYIVCAIAMSLVITGTAIGQEAQRGAQGREAQRAPLGQEQRDQQPGQPGQPGQLGQQDRIEHEARRAQIGQPGQHAGELENHVAATMLLANKAQVKLNEKIKDKLESDDVRKFAEKMIEEHRAGAEKMEQHAPQAARMEIDLDADRDDQQARQPGQPGQPGQLGQQRQPGQTGQLGQQQTQLGQQSDQLQEQLLDIEKRAFEEGISMFLSEVEDKDGDKLDKAYLSQQVAAHMAMCARLSAVEGHVSGELNQIVQDSKDKVKSHLEKAKELLKERDDS
jgi:predicted outer membrane protein